MPQHRPDPSGESALWTELSHRLRGLARGLTRREHEADDLTQQTIAQVLARSPERALHVGYLRQTMLRLWLSQQRSARRQVARLLRVAAERALSIVPSDGAAHREAAERVRDAIELLPPQQRAVLALRLIEELDYGEIAETLGISIEAVRATLHLARARVRAVVGEEQ